MQSKFKQDISESEINFISESEIMNIYDKTYLKVKKRNAIFTKHQKMESTVQDQKLNLSFQTIATKTVITTI